MKTAVITGASRGIGRAIAERLAEQGYDLALLGRDQAALKASAERCSSSGASVAVFCADLTDSNALNETADQCLNTLGQVDVLVNNAGTASRGAVQDADLSAWRQLMALNFDAALALTHRLLPGMIARKSGAVINISSISGRHTGAGGAIYAAAKHALNGFSGCLFEDVREFGIKVSTIMPGFVDTALTADLGKQGSAMIRPSDIAEAVSFVLASSSHCCPTEIVIRPQFQP